MRNYTHTQPHYFLSRLKKALLLEKDTVFGGLMQSSVRVHGLASETWAGFLPLLAPLGQVSLHRAPAAPAVVVGGSCVSGMLSGFLLVPVDISLMGCSVSVWMTVDHKSSNRWHLVNHLNWSPFPG